MFNCYEQSGNFCVRKKDLSDKDIFVLLEYLESVGIHEFEYHLDDKGFANEKERKDFINLVYKAMNLRKLRDSDSFFGVHPFKRLLVAFAGQLFCSRLFLSEQGKKLLFLIRFYCLMM